MHSVHADPSEAIAALSDQLQQALMQGKKVLWLVSGGSNIQAAAEIMSRISSEQSRQLTIGLIDERYGEIGHTNSNWQALLNAGIDTKQAMLMPILLMGHDRHTTAQHYQAALKQVLSETDIAIGLLGMGEDGHTAGILPHSRATEDTERLVVDYSSDPYERITLSFAGLKKLDVVYLFAFGKNKQAQLDMLQNQNLPLTEQPVQIIKHIHDAYVYNEGKEE